MDKLDWNNGVTLMNGNEAVVVVEAHGYLFGYSRSDNEADDYYATRWDLSGRCADGVTGHQLVPKPTVEKRYAAVYLDGGRLGAGNRPYVAYFWENKADRSNAPPNYLELAFTFKDGKLDTTVAPEWVK